MNATKLHVLWLALLLVSLASVSTARAQLRLESPAVEACAEQIYAAVRPLSRGPYRRWEILPTLYDGLGRADACHFPEALKEAMRLDALELRQRTELPHTEAYRRLARHAYEAIAPLVARTRDPACEHGEVEGLYTHCLPAPIPVRELNVGTRPRFLMGSTRLLLVQIVNAVAAADARLMASAQLLYMYASWMNCECVPSITFLWMRRDLREHRVRLSPYPDERLETPAHPVGVSVFPEDRAAGTLYRPFRRTSHPVHLSPGM